MHGKSSLYVTNLSLMAIGIVVFEICFWVLTWFRKTMIEGSYDIMTRGPLRLSHHPVKFDSHRSCRTGVIMVLQDTPSPLPTRGDLENCLKDAKSGTEQFRLIRGELKGFFMFGWEAECCHTCFSLSYDLLKTRDQRFMWIYGWDSLRENHHPAKFRDHRHCGSGNIKF